jgi:nitroimidazol reductase NimA-like FMN-containing flavoprotein (pyridoxamine 5'-phosphate oxidase superfamily)
MSTLPVTPRTRLVRRAERGSFDRATIDAILDEALICHIGFALDGQPYVLPTVHVRIGTRLYVHGSVGSRMLRALREGVQVCVTVTLLDGLVLARSAFRHSMNYRSVVVLGSAEEVTDPEEKRRVFGALVEHIVTGRSREVRAPDDSETRATTVLSLPIEEASAKIRTGPPLDDARDHAQPCWAGVIPLELTAGAPLADPALAPGVALPQSLQPYRRAREP